MCGAAMVVTLLCFGSFSERNTAKPRDAREKMLKQTTRRRQGSDYIEYIL